MRLSKGYSVMEDSEEINVSIIKYPENMQFINELKKLINEHKRCMNNSTNTTVTNTTNNNAIINGVPQTVQKSVQAENSVVIVTEKVVRRLERSMTSGKSLLNNNNKRNGKRLSKNDYPTLHCTCCGKELDAEKTRIWFYGQNRGLSKDDPRRLDPTDENINYDDPTYHHYCSECWENVLNERGINAFRRSFRQQKFMGRRV